MTIAFLAACNPQSPQELFNIGKTHWFGQNSIRVEDDKANEQYVIYYNIDDEYTYTLFFSFTFTNERSVFSLTNSDEFDYTDNLGSEIVFENGYYLFYGLRLRERMVVILWQFVDTNTTARQAVGGYLRQHNINCFTN